MTECTCISLINGHHPDCPYLKRPTELGYVDGDACNRNGCTGIIELEPSENCSCHICAPCSSCTAPRMFCPECEWHERDDICETCNGDGYVVVHNKIVTDAHTKWERTAIETLRNECPECNGTGVNPRC